MKSSKHYVYKMLGRLTRDKVMPIAGNEDLIMKVCERYSANCWHTYNSLYREEKFYVGSKELGVSETFKSCSYFSHMDMFARNVLKCQKAGIYKGKLVVKMAWQHEWITVKEFNLRNKKFNITVMESNYKKCNTILNKIKQEMKHG